jgi:hypothetical protein
MLSLVSATLIDVFESYLISGFFKKKTDMDSAYSTYGGEETCVRGFDGETWGKETTSDSQA